MSIYSEIISWVADKPLCLRDAIRRLLNGGELLSQDITEVFGLLKKENGFGGISLEAVPVSDSDIPTTSRINNTIKLKQISSPHNIAALYENM